MDIDNKDSGSTLMSDDKLDSTYTPQTPRSSKPTYLGTGLLTNPPKQEEAKETIPNVAATGNSDITVEESGSDDAANQTNPIDKVHAQATTEGPGGTRIDSEGRTWHAQGTPQANLRNMIEGAKNPAQKARLEERLKRREPRAAERYARREVRAEGIHQKHDPQGYRQSIEDAQSTASEAESDRKEKNVPIRSKMGERYVGEGNYTTKPEATKPVKELKQMKSSFDNNKISLREQGEMDRLSPLWNTKI